jgi:hypothetical protein
MLTLSLVYYEKFLQFRAGIKCAGEQLYMNKAFENVLSPPLFGWPSPRPGLEYTVKKIVLLIRNSISQSGRRRTKLSVGRKINLFSVSLDAWFCAQLVDFLTV